MDLIEHLPKNGTLVVFLPTTGSWGGLGSQCGTRAVGHAFVG